MCGIIAVQAIELCKVNWMSGHQDREMGCTAGYDSMSNARIQWNRSQTLKWRLVGLC